MEGGCVEGVGKARMEAREIACSGREGKTKEKKMLTPENVQAPKGE